MLPHAFRSISLANVLTLPAVAVGCASYRTPGGPAPIGEMTAASVAERLRSVPETPLPAIIAFTRVQESGYRSWNDGGVDRGSLSLVADSATMERCVTDAQSLNAVPFTLPSQIACWSVCRG